MRAPSFQNVPVFALQVVLFLVGALVGCLLAVSPFYFGSMLGAAALTLVACLDLRPLIYLVTLSVPLMQAFNVTIHGQELRVADLLIMPLAVVLILRNLFNNGRSVTTVGGRRLVFPGRRLTLWALIVLAAAFATQGYSSFAMSRELSSEAASVDVRLGVDDLVGIVKLLLSAAYVLSGYSVIAGRSADRTTVFKLVLSSCCVEALLVVCEFLWLNTGHPPWHLPGQRGIFGSANAGSELLRPVGTFEEPGDLAVYLTLMFSVCAALFVRGRRNSLVSATLLLSGVALLLTFSSAGLAAALFVTVGALRNSYHRTRLIVVLVLIFVVAVMFPDAILSATVQKTDSFSALDRLLNAQIVVAMFRDHPIAGVGYYHYGLLRNYYAGLIGSPIAKTFRDLPNSLYLGIPCEQGIVGGLVWTGAMVGWFRTALAKSGQLQAEVMLLVALGLAIAFVSRSVFTLSYALWYLGLFLGNLDLERPKCKLAIV